MSRRDTPTRIEYTAFGAQAVKLGYRAAETIRKGGARPPVSGSGDYHARWDLPLLRAESQRLDRDNGLYAGLLNRALDNILGEGFTLQAQTGNQRLNRQIEELWAEWGQAPEVRGMDDWPEVERLAMRHLLADGDISALKLDDGLIQLIEADRIAYKSTSRGGNRVEGGIELDRLGRPLFFHVANYDNNGQVHAETKPYGVEHVVYVANRTRISHTRGIPCMVNNFPMIHRINDVCDSEAIAWQLLSRLSLAIYRRDAADIAYQTSTADPNASGQDLAVRVHDIGDAMIFHAEPGEEIKGIERTIPGANFPESIRMFLRLLGLPLGFPLELVLLDWSNTNYSSARAALLQAYRMFRYWQRKIGARFHAPIYRWKLQQWIAAGLLPDRPSTYKHDWIAPPFPWVDPLKEAQAEGEQMDRGFGLYYSVLKGRNLDPEDFLEARAAEIEQAIKRAQDLNSKYPKANVDWRIFAGLKSEKVAPAAMPAPQNVPDDDKSPQAQGGDDGQTE